MTRFRSNIETFAVGELVLPATESETVTNCVDQQCPGKLQLVSQAILLKMRNRPCVGATEPEALICDTCKSTCIDTALDRGFYRCFGTPKLTDEQTMLLIWKGFEPKPLANEGIELDRWWLKLASIQVKVNIHDWKHRASCFKNGREQCRYKTPHLPCENHETEVVYAINLEETTHSVLPPNPLTDDIVNLNINLQKRSPFVFLTDCNVQAIAVLNCNNCTRYVENQKVSLYYGAYLSKLDTENVKALAEVLRALTAYHEKTEERRRLAESPHLEEGNDVEDVKNVPHYVEPPTDASIGLGRILSAARASTNGDTVGAPLAAFVALGNNIFAMSHQTAVLPLNQMHAFLLGLPMKTTLTKKGKVFTVVYDYLFRNSAFENLNLWDFVATQQRVPFQDWTEPNSDDDSECNDDKKDTNHTPGNKYFISIIHNEYNLIQ